MSHGKKKAWGFRVIKKLVALFYPKMDVVGLENLPKEPCILVGNHAQLHGPIACELYFPENCYTWCASQMMELKEVPAYVYADFWAEKPKLLRPFFKLASYVIAPLSVLIFNNARTVAVYKDNRVLNTFRTSLTMLKEGNNLVIFPEHDKEHNHIVADFQEGFVDIAKLYYKRTGKEISFVPFYLAPKLKSIYLGKPVSFSAAPPMEEERRRICDTLMEDITTLALALPEHTVVPYRNIPKKQYVKNTHQRTDFTK